MSDNKDIRDLYKAMLNEAENIGLKVISDERCCQLLAWLYTYGSGLEAPVLNLKLHEDLKLAARRLNIEGGEIPSAELTPILRKYCKELCQLILDSQNGKDVQHPDWVLDIHEKYNIGKPSFSSTIMVSEAILNSTSSKKHQK